MGNIVRRVESSLSSSLSGEEFLPPVLRRDGSLTVTSRKCLGVQPQVLIEWQSPFELWRTGYKLMVFRSTSGFSPRTLSG